MKTTEQLAADLETLQAGNCWIGYNANDIIQDITVEMALFSAYKEGNTIWQLVSHISYWRELVMERITSKKRSPEDPQNGFSLPPVVDKKNWQLTIARFNEVYSRLLHTIRNLDNHQLPEIIPGKGSLYYNISGCLQHDAFHLGQIVMLKQLARQMEGKEH